METDRYGPVKAVGRAPETTRVQQAAMETDRYGPVKAALRHGIARAIRQPQWRPTATGR